MSEIFSPEAVHVIPLNDLHPHDEDQRCRCQPKLETERDDDFTVLVYIWVHNAWDGRENYEDIEEV